MGVNLMPFADNWAYLQTEMCWLDRLLMLAVARQRKETATVNKTASAKGDRVSAHWWKGVISVSKPGYDDARVPASTRMIPVYPKESAPKEQTAKRTTEPSKKIGYQQQMETRIQASAQENTVLALPSLKHYLNLTLFEKNLVLLALAPEINRRYGRLYHYLQTGEDCAGASDLPMLDLALRLLCRNELDRRRARARLSAPGSLIDKGILQYVAPYMTTTRLNSYLRLSDEWVDYLLSEHPDQHVLFAQLAIPPAEAKPVLALPAPTVATRAVKITQPAVPWNKLILPVSLLTQLQALGQQASASILTRYAMPSTARPMKGKVALLVGENGTGKTTAAGAMATSSRQPLCVLDLRQVHPVDWKEVLESLEPKRYPVLYIRGASLWFGRHSPLPKAELAQWLNQRQSAPGLTILGVRYAHMVKAHWRQEMDTVLTLPFPNKNARTILWRQAFAGITCSDRIDWAKLAKQVKLSGGDIERLAKAAIAIAQHENAEAVTLVHIHRALSQKSA